MRVLGVRKSIRFGCHHYGCMCGEHGYAYYVELERGYEHVPHASSGSNLSTTELRIAAGDEACVKAPPVEFAASLRATHVTLHALMYQTVPAYEVRELVDAPYHAEGTMLAENFVVTLDEARAFLMIVGVDVKSAIAYAKEVMKPRFPEPKVGPLAKRQGNDRNEVVTTGSNPVGLSVRA